MKQWQLVDCLEPLEEDEENPRVAIHSEEQLRQELQHMQQRTKHGAALLDSPDMGSLSFSIGGPFASFGWDPPLGQERHSGGKEALPEHRFTEQSVQCWGEGIPTDIDPEYLFPVEQVVEALIYFYKMMRLPEWITWRTWNPATLTWETHPRNGTPGSVSTQPRQEARHA